MSGGSFNYLLYEDSAGMLWRRHTVRDMAEYLGRGVIEPGDAAPAAAALTAYANLLDGAVDEITRVHAELYDLMYAVEWKASGDWGADQLLEACDAFVPPAPAGGAS